MESRVTAPARPGPAWVTQPGSVVSCREGGEVERQEKRLKREMGEGGREGEGEGQLVNGEQRRGIGGPGGRRGGD